MATLNPLVDFTTEPITRQTLFDMWSSAAFGSVGLADLDSGFSPIVAGSDFSDAPTSPGPGQLFWHRSENVMYCWHDEVDNTGVSLWLAIGPDKFEVAALASTPMPAAFPCAMVYDRWMEITNVPLRCIGMNQSGINDPRTINQGPDYGGETTASGSWFRMGVDGLLHGVILNALSSTSQALMTASNKALLSLDPAVGREGSMVNCNSINFPLFQPIGLNTEYIVPEASTGGRPTEPAYIFKFQFAVRNHKMFF